MKIVIPGGTGQVGTLLARSFQTEGHEVIVLSRHPGSGTPWRVVPWDGRTVGAWAAEVDGSDVVINLAGRSVNCRYGEKNRREILDS
ncbi:MAG TPA: NAD-dependent epimerase/dehydratase family protein, partial [Thermoanaerobaculia bacterium]|nr:NAD-dependent epimerase/dehydratase family protein [Thermoanaerobaculia bacterium]